MDKLEYPREEAVLTAALAAGRDLGLRWTILERQPRTGRPRPDALLRLHFGRRDFLYTAAVKQTLRPATLGPTLHQLEPYGEQALLVADHVTPPLAETLRARGVQFIDTAGNAYLNHPPLLIFVRGQRPAGMWALREAKGRAFQAAGLQVLFVLLCKPELVGRPYREIAALAGVAHGTVGWVMAELPKLGYVAEVAEKRRLLNGERLLEQWVEAYARTLRHKLLLERYHAERLDFTKTLDATQYGLLIGGEPAAARLTQNLLPGTATFYGQKA